MNFRGCDIAFLDEFFYCFALFSFKIGLNIGLFFNNFRNRSRSTGVLSFPLITTSSCLLGSIFREGVEFLFAAATTFDWLFPHWSVSAHPLKPYGIDWTQDQTIGVWSVRRYWSIALSSRGVVLFCNSNHPKRPIMVPLSMQYILGGA